MSPLPPIRKIPLNFKLHPKQEAAFKSEANEIMYGGAAGGGKSFLMRFIAIFLAYVIPGLQVYIFRRTSGELIKNHLEGRKGFRAMLGPWVKMGYVQIVKNEIRFKNGSEGFDNGSRIYLCHCQHEKDIHNYQGAEIDVLLIDEITHWTQEMYRYLRGRVRSTGLDHIPEKWRKRVPLILLSGNPGGIGFHWVKAQFVDPQSPMTVWKTPKTEGGMLRQYIPALLEDNPSMAEDDPEYEDRLEGLGNPELVKALRYGIWDIIVGAFFPEMTRARHVLPTFQVPDHWFKFRSFDWGSGKPFSVGWWAMADGSPFNFKGHMAVLPRGAIIRYREWYGKVSITETNKGLRLTSTEVAKGICERSPETEKIHYTVADPAIFASEDGPSIAEKMHLAGVACVPADNSRVAGWDEIRYRLKGVDNYESGKKTPLIYFMDSCVDCIRTLAALPIDDKNREDADTKAEDHAPDEARYACMSRPLVTGKKSGGKPKGVESATLNQLWQMHDKQKKKKKRGII